MKFLKILRGGTSEECRTNEMAALFRRAATGIALAALCLCASVAKADAPTSAVSTRTSFLFNGTFNSNAVPAITNPPSGNYTNILLTAPFQHGMLISQFINASNQIVPAALEHTNYWDLGKIIATNNGTANVFSTNWTSTNGTAFSTITAGTAMTNSVAFIYLNYTNYDGFDLIRLTKMGENSTNNYQESTTITQVP